jgi:carboxylate-amine ligase
MKFVPQAGFTVGCEWELQLVRADSLELADGILALLGKIHNHALIKPEFLQCCIEINTPPCADAAAIEVELQRVLGTVHEHADSLGVRLVGAGTHPFDSKPAIVTPSARYLLHSDSRGSVAVHPVTFATHIHVACKSGDAAIRAMRRMSPLIPVMLAIGANSPFWHGIDTGYVSFRQRLLAANPTYGLPPYFDTWEDFNRMLAAAVRTGGYETFRDLHWDIRPHGDIGTLEIRTFDSQVDAHRNAQIAALVRALVAVASDPNTADSDFLPQLPHWMELENHFAASKSGLQGKLITSVEGQTTPMTEVVAQLFDTCRATAVKLGDGALLQELEENVLSENGARRQREVLERRHSFEDVTRFLADNISSNQREPEESLCGV